MKKAVLTLLFCCLLFLEAWLCAGFLPLSWQTKIQQVLPRSTDNSINTHPNLEGEIDQALQHHPGLRLTFYGILIVMVVVNALLLRVVRRGLIDASEKSASIPSDS